MRAIEVLKLAARALGACVMLLPVSGQAQYRGGLDGSAFIGERGTYGGTLGGDMSLSLCDEPSDCAFALGGSMQVGVATAEQDVDSRVWLAVGPSVSVRGLSTVVWDLALDLGAWVGGRDESLDGGYHLGVRGFVGLPLSESVAFGLRAALSLYGGARDWVVFAPGLAFRWQLPEVT